VQVRTLEARLKDAQRSLAQENDSLRSGLSDAQEQIKVLRGRISLQVEAQAGVQEQLEASR
jgi:FtsZ-binding cell division protein ZapB